MPRDKWDAYLEQVDKKGTTGSLSRERQRMPSQELPRPKMGWPWQAGPMPDKTPPSKAPAGMATSVKGDIGKYRGEEANKVGAGKLGGKAWKGTPFRFRKDAMQIDGMYGPGDTVCG